MATKRSRSRSWVAPRSGGYSANKSSSTGRFIKNGTGRDQPPPPPGRAAPSSKQTGKDKD